MAAVIPSSSSQQPKNDSYRNNGTFKWTDERDKLMLREETVVEPYLYKPGTKEAGLKWSEVAEKINGYALFSNNRDQRSVREHFHKLLSSYKRKTSAEEKESGTAPDPPTETEQLLEDIVERMKTTPTINKDEKKEEKKRKEALNTRDKAMTTWIKGKNKVLTSDDDNDDDSDKESKNSTPVKRKRRRRGSEAVNFLEEKAVNDAEAKKEEIQFRREIAANETEIKKEEMRFKREMAEKEAEARKEEIMYKREMAAIEVKRQDMMQQQMQMQQQQMQQMQTMMLAFVSKMSQK